MQGNNITRLWPILTASAIIVKERPMFAISARGLQDKAQWIMANVMEKGGPDAISRDERNRCGEITLDILNEITYRN